MSDPRPGTSTRDPLKLCACIRARYWEHLSEAKDLGISTATIETLRDLERQTYYLNIGVSKTLRSYHLPQPPHGLSLAYDVAPYDYLVMKFWNPGGEYWQTLADVGRDLGLLWGGDWKWKDRPHFYMLACECDGVKAETPTTLTA